jgi:hypothetical protein
MWRHAFLVFLFAGSRALPSHSAPRGTLTETPMIVTRQGHEVTVALATAVRTALRRYYPGFSLPSLRAYDPEWQRDALGVNLADEYRAQWNLAAPFACLGDFDGNGLPDVALLVHKQHTQWRLVAFHQTRHGTFRPYQLSRWTTKVPDRHLEEGIVRVPKGPITYLTGRPSLGLATMRLRHDGINFYSEEGGLTYYFRQGRYQSVHTGD